MAYVMYHEEHGVFLGICLGLAFWSKLDPVGQPAAATFDSPADALKFCESWGGGAPANVRYVEVDADVGGTHASIASCVRSGLPGWIDEETPVENSRPI
jgi:hypothetical protein